MIGVLVELISNFQFSYLLFILYEKRDFGVEKIISPSAITISEDSKKSLSWANKEGVIFKDQ